MVLGSKRKLVSVGSHQLHYKLPSSFDQSIKKKLEDGKDKLLLNEYAALARDLSRPIISMTQSPNLDLIEFVVEKVMAEYPLVVIADDEDPVLTKVYILQLNPDVFMFIISKSF